MRVHIIENEKKYIDNEVVMVNFPELLGSEKQIDYGIKKRKEKVAIMEMAYKSFRDWLVSYDGEDAEYLFEMDKEKEEWFVGIYQQTSATFWINCDAINFNEIEEKFKKFID